METFKKHKLVIEDIKLYNVEDLISFGKKCFYKGYDKALNDDANCYTAWREEFNSLLENYKVPKPLKK